jgi:hypothetical protein
MAAGDVSSGEILERIGSREPNCFVAAKEGTTGEIGREREKRFDRRKNGKF